MVVFVVLSEDDSNPGKEIMDIFFDIDQATDFAKKCAKGYALDQEEIKEEFGVFSAPESSYKFWIEPRTVK